MVETVAYRPPVDNEDVMPNDGKRHLCSACDHFHFATELCPDGANATPDVATDDPSD